MSMTTDEKVAVFRAWCEGKECEFRSKSDPCCTWRDLADDCATAWAFKFYDYRIKPEPPILPCGCTIEENDKTSSSVYWNPFNKVVQCHKCGWVYTVQPSLPRPEPPEPPNPREGWIPDYGSDCMMDTKEQATRRWPRAYSHIRVREVLPD